MRRWIVEGEDERDMREKEEWKNNKSICHTHPYYGKFVTLLLHVAKNIRFGTFDKLGFLVFGVKCAKYLAFDTYGTADMNALNVTN